jgi:hypothetical protein
MTVPVTPKVVFPHIGPGRYEVTLFVPGSALWKSEAIELSDTPIGLDVKLEPGADLHCEVDSPGGDAADKPPLVNLKSGARDFRYPYYDYRTHCYRGLPSGEYELKVSSSKERAEMFGRYGRGRSGKEIQIEPVPYDGFTRTIVVDDKSPALIDLGTIRLTPRIPTRPSAELR